MDIAITSLAVAPDKFNEGQPKTAVITFKGIIGQDSLNPVSMIFKTQEGSPVFVIDENGDEVKSITWEEEFDTDVTNFNHNIEIVVKKSQISLTAESVLLTAKTSTGQVNQSGSRIFYK